ncbi:MAG TPA: nuclear transport factor 2 family protein [Candidatus Angelobacter sp.]|nr:nuclear transport factor 2 family protein [Candidatus Angelobacter sp.]
MLRSALVLLALILPGIAACSEEIQLENCDRLLTVEVRVSGMKFLFLVDTAATTMLNLKAFPHGDDRQISVTSWSGTVETRAQEVTVADLAIGQHHFKNFRFPAVDLSGIGRACGRQISGILGIDLLQKLGAEVDLKSRQARLVLEPENLQARVEELHRQLTACEQHFNQADESAFAECLDPQVVIFTIAGDYYGREAAMQYYRTQYFQQHPPAQVSITPRAHHPLGDAIWVEYDLKVERGQQVILARGTALCQKTNGRWRIAHMNHSRTPEDSTQNSALSPRHAEIFDIQPK